jgi:predicted metal-dependent hydrolase
MEFTYRVVRSARRRQLTITVERDRSVVVLAPESTSDAKIAEVVEAKRLWIYEKLGHPQKYQERPHAPGKEMVSGESALYLGRQYRIEVSPAGPAGVKFANRFLIAGADTRERLGALRGWYLARAREKIVPRVANHARDLGVTVAEVRVVDSRFRWGSCTLKDHVNLNWRLIKAPMFVIDYVVVHELAHLLEANHTPRFWNIVRAQIPTMEKAKAWLKEHGQLLEEFV